MKATVTAAKCTHMEFTQDPHKDHAVPLSNAFANFYIKRGSLTQALEEKIVSGDNTTDNYDVPKRSLKYDSIHAKQHPARKLGKTIPVNFIMNHFIINVTTLLFAYGVSICPAPVGVSHSFKAYD